LEDEPYRENRFQEPSSKPKREVNDRMARKRGPEIGEKTIHVNVERTSRANRE